MAGVRFAELQSRPMEFLDFTSVTLAEFQQLVPPFEVAFQARMAAWRMDGKPRTARRFTVYKNCPLPTPEDRLLFILTYLKTYALQVVHGRLFGMVQGKANQWIHVLLPALLAALRALGDAPARYLTALALRLGVGDRAAPVLDHGDLAQLQADLRGIEVGEARVAHGREDAPEVGVGSEESRLHERGVGHALGNCEALAHGRAPVDRQPLTSIGAKIRRRPDSAPRRGRSRNTGRPATRRPRRSISAVCGG